MGATVKICGLQRMQTLESMVHLPVDHIGFVFADSKRRVSPEQAGAMIRYIRAAEGFSPQSVGVFVNPSEEQLNETLKQAPLDVVQLHGQETPALCRQVREARGVKVFKVFSVKHHAETQDAMQRLEPFAGVIDGMLLDTYDPITGGGTGQAFNWGCIPSYHAWTAAQGIPLIIAGGLHDGNVKELLEQYRPDGVDVSSGVETNGMKDMNKITAFVERVKSYE